MPIRMMSPAELMEPDLQALVKYAKTAYDKPHPSWYVDRAFSGELQLWRAGELLLGTTLHDLPHGREMWLELVVGKGFLREAPQLLEEMRYIARRAGAKRLTTSTVRPGLAKVYSQMGLKPVALTFSEEIL